MPQFKNQVVNQLIITDGAGNTITITAGPPPEINITGDGSLFIRNETTGQVIGLQLNGSGTPEIIFVGSTAGGNKAHIFTFDDLADNILRQFPSPGDWSIYASEQFWTLNGLTTGEGVLFDPNDSEMHSYHNGVNQDWTNLTLQNGWTAKVGYYAPAYRFTPSGTIELRGVMTGGTSVDNTIIALMPVVPAKLSSYGGVGITAGGSALKRVFYNTDGKLYCYGVSGTGDLSLDGARFSYK
jgi:hypothetical protein